MQFSITYFYFLINSYLFIYFLNGIYGSEHFLRGLNPSYKEHYNPSSEFTCLDNSGKIPFDQVNDDYCDCPDGSDEPGTSACQNGIFYCANDGYRPSIHPSSRVNDGVCDCCDGSDEYSGIITCKNNCLALGEELRLEEERKNQRFVEGYQIYVQYSEEGHNVKVEKKTKIQELQVEKSGLESEQKHLEAKKKELEEPEEEAKNRFKLAWEETKAQRKAEKKKEIAMKTFQELDADSDGRVSLEEMRGRSEFDIDSNGEVSHDEAKEYMEDHDYLEFAVFFEKVWDNVEQLFKDKIHEKPVDEEDITMTTPIPLPPPPPSSSSEDTDERREDDDDDDEDEEDDIDADREGGDDDDGEHKKETKPTVEKPTSGYDDDNEEMPPYDEETQKIIDAAEHARSEVTQLETKLRDIEKEIEHAQKIIDSDYGPQNEYYPLSGQCFELTDHEYVYRLCPFDRTTQRNKHGGSETTLGYWSKWDDSNDVEVKYSAMYFDRGQNCWNGPDRSTKVLIECGTSNDLTSASEPNRCEYQFTFSTPAACNKVPQQGSTTPRVEL